MSTSVAQRPSIAPGLLADLTAAAPARLVKKLDATPTLAESWTWTAGDSWTVVTDTNETVTLRPENGALSAPAHVACSCLLAPKCLHLLAVAAVLPVADSVAQEVPLVSETPAAAAAPAATVTLSASQLAAVALARRAAERLLAEGAQGAGALLRADWLRAAHAGRAESLPRLASACTRVAAALNALQTRSPGFRLDALTADVAEALTVAHALSAGEVAPAWIGVARRVYRTVGHLTLTGLFTEPVVREGGARGVRTWLRDASGRLYRLADIQPGDDQRARTTYDRGADIGDVSASHRALGRGGLFLQGATASDDGRLGSGQGVKAVLGPGVTWTPDAPDLLFARPVGAQVAVLSQASLDADDEADLVFFRARGLGAFEDAVALDAGLPEPVLARAALAVEGLPHRESLRALACAVDVTALFVGRLRWSPRPEVHLLAVGGGPALPDAVGGPRGPRARSIAGLAPGRRGPARARPGGAGDHSRPLRAAARAAGAAGARRAQRFDAHGHAARAAGRGRAGSPPGADGRRGPARARRRPRRGARAGVRGRPPPPARGRPIAHRERLGRLNRPAGANETPCPTSPP